MSLIKRIFDVFVSICIVVLTFQFVLFASLLILIFDGTPVFYKARRVGKNRKEIIIYKFRTMIRNADSIGPSITYGKDIRATKLGRILRNTKIDELPQIINVLKGNMSIVGPRPESMEIVEQFTHEQMQILEVKPGLTSLGALHYFMHQQDEKVMNPNSEKHYIRYQLPVKIKMDIDYIKRYRKYGILEDVRIIILTIFAIFIYIVKKPLLRK